MIEDSVGQVPDSSAPARVVELWRVARMLLTVLGKLVVFHPPGHWRDIPLDTSAISPDELSQLPIRWIISTAGIPVLAQSAAQALTGDSNIHELVALVKAVDATSARNRGEDLACELAAWRESHVPAIRLAESCDQLDSAQSLLTIEMFGAFSSRDRHSQQ